MDAQACLLEKNRQADCEKLQLQELYNSGEMQCNSFMLPGDMKCTGDQAVLDKDILSKNEQYQADLQIIHPNELNHNERFETDSQNQTFQHEVFKNQKQAIHQVDSDKGKIQDPIKQSEEQTDMKSIQEISTTDNSIENQSNQYEIHPESMIREDNGDQLNSDSGQFQAADELVRKLCKNGKVMQFQDGDDFIKVIVYEDSEETADHEDTLSAEEIEWTSEGSMIQGERNNNKAKSNPSKNIMDCLLDGNKESAEVTGANVVNDARPPCKRYDGVLDSQAVTPASAIQSNFAQTMNQFAPPGFLPCGLSDFESPGTVTTQAGKKGQAMYTPHPQNDYMFYGNEDMTATESISRVAPLATSSPAFHSNVLQTTPVCGKASVGQQSLHLNSSGEENISPTDIMETPTSHQQHQLQKKVRSLIHSNSPEYQEDDLGKLREQHNQKERKRRARIKEACNLLRQLVPGMSDKTDKATVFEFAARYVHFLKSHTGPQYDKDFLMKYSPY